MDKDVKKKQKQQLDALETELKEIWENDELSDDEKTEASHAAIDASAREMYFDEIEREQDGEVWGDPFLS